MIRRNFLVAGSAFVLVGILIGFLVSAQFNVISIGGAADRAKEVTLGSKAGVPEAILSAQSLNAAFVAIVQDVKPTVVTISTRETRRRSLEEHPFFRYFGDEFRRRFEEQQPEQRSALGSGIIVSQDGYILTNRHVVNDAEKITVTLLDRQEFDAVVVGSDSLTEVAVIKVEGEGLPVARLGESDSLSVGEWVLAFGNPFGLNFTVTQGIVSALGRSMGGGPHYSLCVRHRKFYPDERCDQSGKLRRSSGQPARRSDRHQHRDSDADGVVCRLRVRHSDHPREAGDERPDP